MTTPLKNQKLVASLTLLDDDGTIVFNMTSDLDYSSGNKLKFRAPHVQDYANFNNTKLDKNISNFVANVTMNPFSFNIIDSKANVIYEFDSSKVYFSEFFVFDTGKFKLNTLNGNPLMGMGERAGNLLYKNEDGGVHSRWTHDAANPIDDGFPPGRNMYGFQPFYQYQSFTKNWVGVFNNNPYATDYIVTTP